MIFHDNCHCIQTSSPGTRVQRQRRPVETPFQATCPSLAQDLWHFIEGFSLWVVELLVHLPSRVKFRDLGWTGTHLHLYCIEWLVRIIGQSHAGTCSSSFYSQGLSCLSELWYHSTWSIWSFFFFFFFCLMFSCHLDSASCHLLLILRGSLF
jgi:hypothetical protein